MKIKLEIKELIETQNKTKERCVELIGGGVFSIRNLENIIEALKKVNEIASLLENNELNLEESLIKFDEANKLIKELEETIIEAKEKIENNKLGEK